MTGPRPAELLRHLVTETAPDRDLLRRYAATRDGDAFAELVRRHGPVVLAASRRGVRHHHEADDMFQAVFLVLARRAGTIDRPELLGNWLYGVAVRVARHARRAAARRRRHEVQAVDVPEPAAPPAPAQSDLGPVLDEELDALPALYRDAVVLCDLRGVSRADAAARLGIPLGTLASRLDGGRKKLAARLVRRGVALSAAAVLVEARAVAVPAALFMTTCLVGSGETVPAAVLRLARGGSMMRTGILGGVLAVSLAAGAALAGLGTDPGPPGPPAQPPVAAVTQPGGQPPPAKADPAPATFGPPELTRKEDLSLKGVRSVAWSPDGELLAVSGTATPFMRAGDPLREADWAEFAVVPAGDRKLQRGGARLPDGGRLVGFTADGDVLTEVAEANLISGSHTLQVWTAATDTPGGVKVQFVRVQKGPEFALPDRATGFVPVGPAVRFLVPEYAPGGITRAEVRGVDLKTGAKLGPLGVLTGKFQGLTLSPGGVRVAALTPAGAVEVSGLDGKRAWAAELQPAEATAGEGFGFGYDYLTYSRDGSVLVAARPFRRPAAFDAGTGTPLPPFEGSQSVGNFGWAVAVSADGRLAAVAYAPRDDAAKGGGRPPQWDAKPRLTVWDTRTGKPVRTWEGQASALAFHPTRPVLAVLEAARGGTRLGLWEFPARP